MKNAILLHDILYIGEHLTCNNYMAEITTGWAYQELGAGEEIRQPFARSNHLLFILDGRCMVTCNQFIDREVKAGDIILIPRMAAASGKVIAPLKFVNMAFTVPISGCDKLVLQACRQLCEQMTYDFQPLEIRYPLSEFLGLLVYSLKNGINCAHFHELKHKELFFYLRGFYTKEEVAGLFYPIIAKSFDFRELIYEHAPECTSLAQLIKLSNMSPRTFHRKFTREFEVSPREWMLKQKCLRIICELAQPDVTINDIIHRFAFPSPASFNQFCQRHFRLTPAQLLDKYRRTTMPI